MSITTIATILHVHAELTDRHSGYNNIRRHSSPSCKIPAEDADSCTKPDLLPIRPDRKQGSGQVHCSFQPEVAGCLFFRGPYE